MSRRRSGDRAHRHTLWFVCSRGHAERQVGPKVRVNPERLDDTGGEHIEDDGTVTPLSDYWPVLFHTGDTAEPGVEKVPYRRGDGPGRAKVRLRCPSCGYDVVVVGAKTANAIIRGLVTAGISRVDLATLASIVERSSP